MKSAKSPAASAVPRRGLLIGAGIAGAAALVASKLAGVNAAAADTAGATGGAAKPQGAAGYRLTAHVQRYYQTTKV